MFKKAGRDRNFFDLFEETAVKICETAQMLYDLMTNYVDIDRKIGAIEENEHNCDIQVHKILQLLNRTFITPIDREDIHLIAKEMDNITDAIEATAHRFRMYNVKSITEDAIKLSKMIIECTEELRCIMAELKNMSKSSILSKKVIEVNRIEDDADNIYRNAIANLFRTEKNAVEVVKWKEIYEYLENTLDACEDVANIIEGVVMKHS